MPAPTTWRPLDYYPALMRPIVQFMWDHRPPLNPSQFAARAGVRRQLLSTYLNSPAEARLAPDPEVVRRFARAMGLATSAFMALAGYGTADDPFLDRAEAVDSVLGALSRLAGMETVTPQELATCRRLLEILRVQEAEALRVLALSERVGAAGDPTAAAADTGETVDTVERASDTRMSEEG